MSHSQYVFVNFYKFMGNKIFIISVKILDCRESVYKFRLHNEYVSLKLMNIFSTNKGLLKIYLSI